MNDTDKRMEEIRAAICETIGETFGEAIMRHGDELIQCEGYEWDNANFEDNAVRLIGWYKAEVDALRAEAKAMGGRALAFSCAACGGIGYTEAESIDCGTTLTCDCGGKTVVYLHTTDEYCSLVKLRAEAKAARGKALEEAGNWVIKWLESAP